jgi:hypothetical protein
MHKTVCYSCFKKQVAAKQLSKEYLGAAQNQARAIIAVCAKCPIAGYRNRDEPANNRQMQAWYKNAHISSSSIIRTRQSALRNSPTNHLKQRSVLQN